MTKRRRLLLVLAAAVVAAMGVAFAVIHNPGVQRRAWEAFAGSLEANSDIKIETALVQLRLFPGRLVARDLKVSYKDRTLATVEEIRAAWQWRRLVTEPRRLESVVVDKPVLFGDAVQPPEKETGKKSGFDVWGAFEIGSLQISQGRASAGVKDIDLVLDRVRLQADLVGGQATAVVAVGDIKLKRLGRLLALGPLNLRAEASSDGLVVRSLELAGEAASLSIAGSLALSPRSAGRFVTEIEADLPAIAAWWDPNLVTGLTPDGRLKLVGEIDVSPDGGFAVEIEHQGERMFLAGYDLDELQVSYTRGRPIARVAGSSWGSATVKLVDEGRIRVVADLEGAPVDDLLAFTLPQVAAVVQGPTTVTGQVDTTLSFPIDIDTLAGRVDLMARWSDGKISLRGEGAGFGWTISELDAQMAGVKVVASGSVESGGSVQAAANLVIEKPGATFAELQPWFPGMAGLDIGGGPLEGGLRVGGTRSEPTMDGDVTWTKPMVAGRDLETISVSGIGGRDGIDWRTDVQVDAGSTLEARGRARPLDGEITGDWRISVSDLTKIGEVLIPGVVDFPQGGVDGSGSLLWSQKGFRFDGRLDGWELALGDVAVPRIELQFAVEPDGITIEDLMVDVFGGVVEGQLSAPLMELDGELTGRMKWRDVNLDALPLSLPEAVTGRLSGQADVSGSVSRPEGEISLLWDADGAGFLVDRMLLHIDLSEGVAKATIEELDTQAGLIAGSAEVPLGDLERPPWLWPDAPGGPVSAYLTAEGFQSGPLTETLAVDAFGIELVADLRAHVQWDPKAPGHPRIEAVANGLRFVHPTGELVADGPVEVLIDGRSARIKPVVFTGFDSRFEVEASYDPVAAVVDGRLNALISEQLAQLAPLPVSVRGPLGLTADLHLPASAAPSFDSVTGNFSFDHGDGVLVMRDPPLEVRGLRVSAEVRDGRIDILDGSAEVNRGTVELGGGWDPKSGQGLVFEFDDVMLFVEGILTKWDGDLAVEPRNDKIAHVDGDLTLVVGLWDETFDLASAVLSPDDVELAADDPLYDISLDVKVRGRTGIRVDNNLGRVDVSWDVLRVDGSAAAPRLRGDLRIAPGGVIGLGGQEVRVRRGSLEFTGDPSVDPIVEIVPESDMTLIGSGEDDATQFDASLMASRGLAQGISSVLGFENETLRPAEIAVQTERDPSVNFMVGQRLNRNLALFLTTNLTNVQDRMTMLQGWNFRGLSGLVAQVFQETVDGNIGANLLQRFSWGGTARSLSRPEIHRLRLEGDWPMSKRYLKSATRLRRGQPFDPFLLFVAAVRMERSLAENGYQNARVTPFQEGDPRTPTLVFYCEAGTPQFVHFVGDVPHRKQRADLTAMYRPPPLENSSLEAMRRLLTRSMALEGFPDAEVNVARRLDLIEVSVDRRQEVAMAGPFFDGLPDEIVAGLGARLSSATAIAAMSRRPERVESSVEQRLAALGYLDAEVRSVQVVRLDESTAEVRIEVEPGPRQEIQEVVFVGNDPLRLMGSEAFAVRAGQPLDRMKVDSMIRDLRDEYIEAGYREASGRSEFRRDADGRWVVEIEFEPGPLRRLRHVDFTGLKHVNGRVLGKGLVVSDGEVLTDRAIDRSAARMANFSPIERVEVRTRDVGTSEVDVEFDVVEKDRWAADIGGGWSTERGLSASFGLRDDNLFGRGLGLNIRGGWGSTEKKIFLVGSVPPVPGGRLSLISTVGYGRGDAPDEPDLLEQEETLVSFEAQYALANRVQVGVYYRWTDTRTYEKDPDPFFPLDVRVKLGTVGVRTVVDRFDNLFDPRKGYGLTSDVGWSSQTFGSDLDYLSWLSNFSLALAPSKGATWLQTARLGVAEPLKGQSLVRNARFFAGGQASIRGFDLNSVGPVTYGIDGSLVPAGGGALFILNEELRIPIRGPLRAAVFADIGQVWESWGDAEFHMSIGIGVGVRWSTPIGPLWADVALPVANVGISSKKPKFYLGIGRPF